MKKEICLLLLPIFLISGCGFGTDDTKTPQEGQIITRKTVQDAAKKDKAPEKTETPATPQQSAIPQPQPASQKNAAAATGQRHYPYFEYPYNIEEDRQNFDYNNVDIVVGDKKYMTQINDWFMNFLDYKDKTVMIEGYYLSINGHYFVGRNGPTCPYCTGGYVDFEFTSDQDFTGYEPASTWIRVYGILREAKVHLNDHITAPFYHLEAVKVEKMDQEGIGTITD